MKTQNVMLSNRNGKCKKITKRVNVKNTNNRNQKCDHENEIYTPKPYYLT